MRVGHDISMLWVNDQLFLIRNHTAQTIKYPRLHSPLLPKKDAGSALLVVLILLFGFLVAAFFGWSIVADSNPGPHANHQLVLIPFQTALSALVIPLPLVLRWALRCNAYNRRLRDYLAIKLQ
jgi:hypothetical protein